jgi:hypothetical protein
VFNAARPSIQVALSLAWKEADLWVMAGARVSLCLLSEG